MAVTPADIKTRYPEFAGVDDSRIQFFIDDAYDYANMFMSESVWGTMYDQGISKLTAHYLTIYLASEQSGNPTAQPTPGAGGTSTVDSQAIGDVSISYGSSTFSSGSGGFAESYWAKSIYGQQFWMLSKRFGYGGFVVP